MLNNLCPKDARTYLVALSSSPGQAGHAYRLPWRSSEGLLLNMEKVCTKQLTKIFATIFSVNGNARKAFLSPPADYGIFIVDEYPPEG